MAKIRVTPELAVVDEEVEIVVTDAQPNSPVTVSVSIVYFDILYLGYGHFYVNPNGQLNLKEHASYGGTYCGVEPMGLITSMKAMPSKHSCPRFFVKGSVEKPLPFEISLWKGHLTKDVVHHLHVKHPNYGTKYPSDKFLKQFILATTILNRTYLSPTVERIPVRVEFENEPIRGVMFVPRQKGPFPGVIDVFGATGGSMEFRSALLARHGYASLALAYFDFDGLKATSSTDFEMSYFDKAINWFAKHPLVKPGGIGMIGISLGAQIVLLSNIRNENVRATVCLNTSLFMRTDPELINPLLPDHESEMYEIWRGQRVPIFGRSFASPRPLLHYKHDNPIVFMLGSEDLFSECISDVIDQLQKSGKKNVFKKVFDGQGHLLEPAYWPQCILNSPRDSNVVSDNPYENLWKFMQQQWGGSPKTHGKQQLNAWHYLLEFLSEHLNNFEKSKL